MGGSRYKFGSAEENRTRQRSGKDGQNKKVAIFWAHDEGKEISNSATHFKRKDMRQKK